jgi:hypothetical protein
MTFRSFANFHFPGVHRLNRASTRRLKSRRKTKSGFSRGDIIRIKPGHCPWLANRDYRVTSISYYRTVDEFNIKATSLNGGNFYWFTPEEIEHVV